MKMQPMKFLSRLLMTEERHDDAIEILRKYHSLDSCVVCDNHDFHGNDLLARKQSDRKRIYDALDHNTKELLDKVVKDSGLMISDPFEIKRIISEFIANGESAGLRELQIKPTMEMEHGVSWETLEPIILKDMEDIFDDKKQELVDYLIWMVSYVIGSDYVEF